MHHCCVYSSLHVSAASSAKQMGTPNIRSGRRSNVRLGHRRPATVLASSTSDRRRREGLHDAHPTPKGRGSAQQTRRCRHHEPRGRRGHTAATAAPAPPSIGCPCACACVTSDTTAGLVSPIQMAMRDGCCRRRPCLSSTHPSDAFEGYELGSLRFELRSIACAAANDCYP